MRITINLFTTAALFLLFLGCNSEGFFSEPASDALSGLKDMQKAPEFSLDWINKKQITPGENTIMGNDIEIVGWAMDPDAKKPASKVYLSINGSLFTTEYGIDRSDVANFFENPAYQKSGFRAKFPRSTFQPGTYSIEVKVVGADNSSYFSSPPDRTVLIKI